MYVLYHRSSSLSSVFLTFVRTFALTLDLLPFPWNNYSIAHRSIDCNSQIAQIREKIKSDFCATFLLTKCGDGGIMEISPRMNVRGALEKDGEGCPSHIWLITPNSSMLVALSRKMISP
jgi:hypothetical protein